MIQLGAEHEFYLLLNGMLPQAIPEIVALFDDVLPRTNIRVWHAVGPTDWTTDQNLHRRKAAELIREAFIAYLAPDVVHVTCPMDGYDDNAIFSLGAFGPKPLTAVTFYDAIPLVQSEVYLKPYPTFEAMYRERLQYVAAADALLAISEHARSEAITHLSVVPDKAHNISADTDPKFRRVRVKASVAQRLCERFGLTKRFILYSGATDERKNHLRLIAAYARLSPDIRSNHQLLFAGGTPPNHVEKFKQYARALGISELEFIVAGKVTDEELLLLYNLCALFVMPSWHEGFGLPALEAMRCGAPVIGANTASLPELIADSRALFDPFNTASMSTKLEEVLSSPELSRVLSQQGLERATKFSWGRSAHAALTAIEGLPRKHSGPFKGGIVDALIAKLGEALPADSPDPFLRDVARAIAATFRTSRRRHLLVDVSELIRADAGTGIQRVVNNVVKALLEAPPEDFDVLPVYAAAGAGWYRYARRFAVHALKRKEEIFKGPDDDVELQAGDIFLGLDLHYRTAPAEVSMQARMRAAGGYSYFVVYDLLPVLMPQHFPGGVSTHHLQWLLGVSDADGVVCISKAVADEFIAWLPSIGIRKPLKVGYFHLGSDLPDVDSMRPSNADDVALLEAMDRRPSFLMVGTLEPRKGHVQALIAFEKLWEEGKDVNLVIVGKQGWNVDLQAELIRTSRQLGIRLFWGTRATDAFLQSIYREASCLIAASEGEGFGCLSSRLRCTVYPLSPATYRCFAKSQRTQRASLQGMMEKFSLTSVKDFLLIRRGASAGKVGQPRTWRREQGATAQRCDSRSVVLARSDWRKRKDSLDPMFGSPPTSADGSAHAIHSTYCAGFLVFWVPPDAAAGTS